MKFKLRSFEGYPREIFSKTNLWLDLVNLDDGDEIEALEAALREVPPQDICGQASPSIEALCCLVLPSDVDNRIISALLPSLN